MAGIEPNMGPEHYKTYGIVAPIATHWRTATCAEYGCGHYLGGWRTILGVELTDLIDVVRRSHRSFTEFNDGVTVTFTFPAGQPCFKATAHRVRVDRPEVFVVRDGDRRGNPFGTPPRVHARPVDWVEDFAAHQDRIAAARVRG